MTFAKKIFIAVFLSTLVVGTALIFAAYKYSITRSEEDYISRYQVFSRVLGDTLTRLDANTEVLMLNAAKVVAEKDSKKGLLSTDNLRDLQRELGVTHLFVTDRNGKFIRSTNDDPAIIPNLFSFCPNYQKLITGKLKVEATPVIKPNPEPKPFKFLSIPNADRNRIIEVGVRVDFIAKTLAEAIQSDTNVLSMSLFAPDGTPFGTYTNDNVVFQDQKANLPQDFRKPVADDASVSFFTKVISSHPSCCQCDISGTSRNGEYYYVLESKISRSDLKALQANAGFSYLLVGLGNLVFALIVAKLVSRRLVRNIENAVSRVKSVKAHGGRIGVHSKDEISILTTEFDRLLDSLEESQRRLIQAEKVQSKVELAKTVAHNIKSPVLAIEMMLPGLVTVPERMRRVLKNAVSEIKQLSEKLKNQSDTLTNVTTSELDTDLVFLPVFLRDILNQKELEYSNSKLRFSFENPKEFGHYFVKVGSLDLKSILSNILNNSCDSYADRDGEIKIHLENGGQSCSIRIVDQGAGIPKEYLSKLGRETITFKGNKSRGLGLVHAFKTLQAWGGEIKIDSLLGRGTTVEIILPVFTESNAEHKTLLGNGSSGIERRSKSFDAGAT